jgi:hypothetical protein
LLNSLQQSSLRAATLLTSAEVARNDDYHLSFSAYVERLVHPGYSGIAKLFHRSGLRQQQDQQIAR